MFDVAIDIRNEAQKVVSIFQHEARMNRIALQLVVSPAFEDLGLETVMTDPVRLGQVYVPFPLPPLPQLADRVGLPTYSQTPRASPPTRLNGESSST